MKERQEYKNR